MISLLHDAFVWSCLVFVYGCLSLPQLWQQQQQQQQQKQKQNHQTCATVGSILMADVKCSWERSGSPTSLQHALIQIPELTNNQNKT